MNGVLADFYSWLYQIPLSGYIRFRYITFLGISDSVISVSVISDSTFVISFSVISNSNLVISDSLYQSPLYQNLLYQKDHPRFVHYYELSARSESYLSDRLATANALLDLCTEQSVRVSRFTAAALEGRQKNLADFRKEGRAPRSSS